MHTYIFIFFFKFSPRKILSLRWWKYFTCWIRATFIQIFRGYVMSWVTFVMWNIISIFNCFGTLQTFRTFFCLVCPEPKIFRRCWKIWNKVDRKMLQKSAKYKSPENIKEISVFPNTCAILHERVKLKYNLFLWDKTNWQPLPDAKPEGFYSASH